MKNNKLYIPPAFSWQISETFSDEKAPEDKFAIVELLIMVSLGKISQDFSKKTEKNMLLFYGIIAEFGGKMSEYGHLRLVGGTDMGYGSSTEEREIQEAHEEFAVGKEGLLGNLHKAAVAAKTSPDVVKVHYGGKHYVLKGHTVVRTMMELASDVRNPELRVGDKDATVGVSARGPSAKATLDTVCQHLFTSVQDDAEKAPKPMRKEA